jgi:hypothetical protein
MSDAFVAIDNDWKYTFVNQKAALCLENNQKTSLVKCMGYIS